MYYYTNLRYYDFSKANGNILNITGGITVLLRPGFSKN